MATISNVNGKKITKIKYKGEIFDTGGGVNPLQHIIDNQHLLLFHFHLINIMVEIKHTTN